MCVLQTAAHVMGKSHKSHVTTVGENVHYSSRSRNPAIQTRRVTITTMNVYTA